jgi:predicted unusual protein kinase regulating ubiquinone biosynthesis (AarF/ABC1/UbiB family)
VEVQIQRNTVDSLNLQEVLVKMGPAFIKFGQTLSTRADFLDQQTLDELRQLCYEVHPYTGASYFEEFASPAQCAKSACCEMVPCPKLRKHLAQEQLQASC